MVLPYHLNRRSRETGHKLCTKPRPGLIQECPGFDGWMLDSSDEFAVDRGAWFDPVMGGYAVWWIERYCRLYEDRWAGEPAVQHGCKTCRRTWTIPNTYSPQFALDRNEEYLGCMAAGHDLCWQYGFLMRLFGWMKQSQDLGKPIRRFKKADFWVPKKNMKSPELAFIGWHITVGDGVMGQHTYFGAKDGAQAREIVGGHAVAAYEQIEELQETVLHKLNEMAFIHVPTKSTMKPLSSSNARTTKSKEGINGSVIVDEVHVVDAEFMKRIRRAGISREEPLLLGGSTAGLDVSGYGKERQDYGREVAAGTKLEDEYLFLCYEADQSTDIEALGDEEVVRLGRKANPAWGITILEGEFRSDLRESRSSSLDSLADFGTYRLNIWQDTTTPWLGKHSWDQCADDYDLADLAGQECDMGLDLSRTRDMTAAVLRFDELDGRRSVWPMFWIPENTASKHAKKVPSFEKWVSAGLISLTPQDTISQQQVFDEISAVLQLVHCRRVAYDPTFADWLTEQLEHNGVERFVFKQSLAEYAAPTEEFESEVLDGTLRHPRHEVLDWQASHCHVYRNRGTKQKRPVRPNEKNYLDPRTIDGVAALVMCYGFPVEESSLDYYDSHPLEMG